MKFNLLSNDDRGYIKEIFSYRNFSLLLIKSKKGSIRGNHYYKNETHINFVLKGKIEYFSKKLNSKSKLIKKIYKKKQYFLTEKKTIHAMRFLEDSLMLYFSNMPRKKNLYMKEVIKRVILKK